MSFLAQPADEQASELRLVLHDEDRISLSWSLAEDESGMKAALIGLLIGCLID